jgi:hypothetical protein
VAIFVSLALAAIPYPIEPTAILKTIKAGDSEYVTVHGMPEIIYVSSAGPLHGFTKNWINALFSNFSAILIWMLFIYAIIFIASQAGMRAAKIINSMKQNTYYETHTCSHRYNPLR